MSEQEPRPSVSMRSVTEDDTAFARNVHREAYHDVIVRQFGSWDDALQSTFFDTSWAEPGFQIISYGDSPCGYYRSETLPTEIKAHELVLLPAFQGKGIGTELLRNLQKQAVVADLPIHLQVLKQNEAAELYARLGFSPIDETDTHINMEWLPPQI